MEELLPNKDFASLGEDLRPGVHVAVKLVNWTLAGGSGQCMVGSTVDIQWTVRGRGKSNISGKAVREGGRGALISCNTQLPLLLLLHIIIKHCTGPWIALHSGESAQWWKLHGREKRTVRKSSTLGKSKVGKSLMQCSVPASTVPPVDNWRLPNDPRFH